MVNFIEQGDIFQLEGVHSFAHGCNCAGAMGKGIAVQFKLKFPEMYEEYRMLCKSGRFLPGDVYTYQHGDGVVFNLGTQKSWRTQATLEYVEMSLSKMMNIAKDLHITSIAMPAIGAGLGGLRWGDVKAIINKVSLEHPETDLFVVEKYAEKS